MCIYIYSHISRVYVTGTDPVLYPANCSEFYNIPQNYVGIFSKATTATTTTKYVSIQNLYMKVWIYFFFWELRKKVYWQK